MLLNKDRWDHQAELIGSLISSDDRNGLMAFLQAMLWDWISASEVPAETLASFLAHINAHLRDNTSVFHDSLLDLLWYFDIQLSTEIEITNAPQSERTRLIQLGQAILASGFISHAQMKDRLEAELMEAIGLIPSRQVWSKRTIRINTAMLYKQTKFNLMHEESEGFAKLLNEIYERMQIPPTDDHVEKTLEVIRSIIGYFDLDPNRTLDIFLGLFAENAVKHHDFFLKVILRSPWFHPRHVSNEQRLANSGACAHLIGQRFGFFQSPDITRPVPRDMYLMAALLIKNNVTTLEELFPYLCPEDEKIEKEYRSLFKKAEKEARQSGGSNLLASSVLLDDAPLSASGSKTNPGTPEKVENPVKIYENQKALLCEAMFIVGDSNNGTRLLRKYPSFASINISIVDAVCRHVHLMIEPLFSTLRSKASKPRDLTKPLATAISTYSSTSKFLDSGRDYFNYDALPPDSLDDDFLKTYVDWHEQTPRYNTLEEVVKNVSPILLLLGPRLYRDVTLMTKLIRLVKAGISQLGDEYAESRRAWVRILSKILIPSLSRVESNPALLAEVWSIINSFPYDSRFHIYGQWKNFIYDQYPELVFAKHKTIQEAKRIMRRISKDNYKQFGRKLGKLSHANPTFCFATILDQIQGYENLIVPVIDCFRYTSDLGLDVISFVMIEFLSNPDKQRLKQDGANIALWLNSNHVTKIVGSDLAAILDYTLLQLKDANPFDLVILKELVTKMSGIELLIEGASDNQVEAMAGGMTLKIEATTLGQAKNTRKSVNRLVKALLDNNLGFKLTVLIGKQRDLCVFQTDIPYLKLIGSLFDQVQETLLQFVDFLASNIDQTAYTAMIPGLLDLSKAYKLSPEVCWFVLRSKLSYLIKTAKESHKPDSKTNGTNFVKVTEGVLDEDVVMSDTKPQEEANGHDGSKMDIDVSMKNAESEQQCTWFPGLKNVGDEAMKILPDHIWTLIRPQFYVTFWQLSLYDIMVPSQRYADEIEKQKQVIHAIDHDPVINTREDTPSAAQKRKRDKEKAQSVIDRLQLEEKEQQKNYTGTMTRLHNEKASWLVKISGKNRAEIVNAIIHHCIHPRSIFSANDAIYAAKFLQLMHSIGTPNFSSLTLYDCVINNMGCVVFHCTQNEAMHFGRFLRELFRPFHRWHHNKELYDKEAKGDKLPGFLKRWDANGRTRDEDCLEFKDFQDIMYKWHVKLYKAFLSSLESREYMRVRNTIIILDKIAEFFPSMTSVGIKLEQTIKTIAESEKREDLKVLLSRYSAALVKSRTSWVSMEKFRGIAAAGTVKVGTRPTTTSTTTSTTAAMTSSQPPSRASSSTTVSTTEKEKQPKDQTDAPNTTHPNPHVPSREPIDDRIKEMFVPVALRQKKSYTTLPDKAKPMASSVKESSTATSKGSEKEKEKDAKTPPQRLYMEKFSHREGGRENGNGHDATHISRSREKERERGSSNHERDVSKWQREKGGDGKKTNTETNKQQTSSSEVKSMGRRESGEIEVPTASKQTSSSLSSSEKVTKKSSDEMQSTSIEKDHSSKKVDTKSAGVEKKSSDDRSSQSQPLQPSHSRDRKEKDDTRQKEKEKEVRKRINDPKPGSDERESKRRKNSAGDAYSAIKKNTSADGSKSTDTRNVTTTNEKQGVMMTEVKEKSKSNDLKADQTPPSSSAAPKEKKTPSDNPELQKLRESVKASVLSSKKSQRERPLSAAEAQPLRKSPSTDDTLSRKTQETKTDSTLSRKTQETKTDDSLSKKPQESKTESGLSRKPQDVIRSGGSRKEQESTRTESPLPRKHQETKISSNSNTQTSLSRASEKEKTTGRSMSPSVVVVVDKRNRPMAMNDGGYMRSDRERERGSHHRTTVVYTPRQGVSEYHGRHERDTSGGRSVVMNQGVATRQSSSATTSTSSSNNSNSMVYQQKTEDGKHSYRVFDGRRRQQ